MQLFTVIVWMTVILIMFLSKLKAAQDIMVAIIIVIMIGIFNADDLFGNFRWFKVYKVLKWSLCNDMCSAAGVTFFFLVVHGFCPDSNAPGALLHLAAVAVWFVKDIHTSPLVTAGIWAGGKNMMTRLQLYLRVAAQVIGAVLSFCVFGLYYSFRFPGIHPFDHMISVVSLISAAATFGLSYVLISNRDRKLATISSKKQHLANGKDN